MRAIWCVGLVLLVCTGEFVKGFKIFSELFNLDRDGGEKNKLSADKVHDADKVITDNTGAKATTLRPNNGSATLVFMPRVDEMLVDQNDFYPMVPPPYSLFYGNNAHNLQSFSFPDNFEPSVYREDPYTQFYPPVHSLPQTDDYTSDIQYFPMGAALPYKPIAQVQSLGEPMPYRLPVSMNSLPIPPEVEEDMVKRVIQIVNDFEKANRTAPDLFRVELSGEGTTLMTDEVGSNVSAVAAATSVEKNNTVEVELAEGGEWRIDLNETGPAVTENVEELSSSSTASPSRYVVEQFIDQNGNPCAKEVVLTAEQRTYYVYTCEEKGVPRATTSESNVTQYVDELTTLDTTEMAMKVVSTTPVNEDRTVLNMLNNYLIVNG